MGLLAWVFRPCGPTQGSPSCSFSSSAVVVEPLVPKFISSPRVFGKWSCRLLCFTWKNWSSACEFSRVAPINLGPSAWINWTSAQNNWSSPWVFSRVLGWPTDSFLGGNSHQRETVSVFNPRDSKVPLPLAYFNAVGEERVMTCTDDEASKLVEDSTLMANRIIAMLSIDMS
jgi:hypothetical protein